MTNQNCDLTVSLHLRQFFLKPRKLIAWILSVAHQVVIGVVAGLRVYSNHVYIVVDFVIGGKLLSVVTFCLKFLKCTIVKPHFPIISQEGQYGILRIEILGVNNETEVVITLQWECGPLAQIGLHVIEQEGLIVFDILLGVVPLIVRRNITGPE